ncbi:hypothetical protein HYT25_00775 [Candidatus Pacearchaeota archaeon]|nr:hypothetical protein [Candidatus Pacearchaeota archaeon]
MVNVIRDIKNKLLSVNVVPQISGNDNIIYSFENGIVREEISKIFDSESRFYFMRTFANSEAIDSLDKWDEQLGRDSDSRGVRFDAGLMDVYLNALRILSKQQELVYASYDLVQNKNVHSIDRHSEQPQWPVIHIVRGDNFKRDMFSSLVYSLNCPTAYEIIKEKEAPQNYRMPQVNHLREREINPLTLDEKIWEVDGATLKSAIDNLCVFSYICDSSRMPRVNDDGYP